MVAKFPVSAANSHFINGCLALYERANGENQSGQVGLDYDLQLESSWNLHSTISADMYDVAQVLQHAACPLCSHSAAYAPVCSVADHG